MVIGLDVKNMSDDDILDFEYMGGDPRIQLGLTDVQMAELDMDIYETDEATETAPQYQLNTQLDTEKLNRLMYAVQQEHADLSQVVLHDVDSTWHLSAAFVEEWRGKGYGYDGLRSVLVFTSEGLVVYLIDGQFLLARRPIMFHVEVPQSIMGLPKPTAAGDSGEHELWTWNSDFNANFFERLEDKLEEWGMLGTPRKFGRFQLSDEAQASYDRFVQGF